MKDVLKQAALQVGVFEEEVREKIQKSIHEAYLQKAQAFVAAFGDREPSVQGVLENVAMQVMGVY